MDNKKNELTEEELKKYLAKFSCASEAATAASEANEDNLARFNGLYKNVTKLTELLDGRISRFVFDIKKPHGFIGAVFPALTVCGESAEVFAKAVTLCDRMEIIPCPDGSIAAAFQVENIFKLVE